MQIFGSLTLLVAVVVKPLSLSQPRRTPLFLLQLLSNLQILAKAEFANPGGSVKDRVAAAILSEATTRAKANSKSPSMNSLLRPGGLVTEGTAGSTGVSLAMLSPCFGVRAAVWMPDDAAEEKSAMVRGGGGREKRRRR